MSWRGVGGTLVLAVAGLGCGRHTNVDSPPSKSSAIGPSSSAVPSAPAISASSEPVPSIIADPAFEAFTDRVKRDAKVRPNPATEADARIYYRQIRDYSLAQTRSILAGLSPEQRRGILTPSQPRRNVPGDWHPAWNRWIATVTLINDASQFFPGPYRMTGTIREDVLLGWSASFAQEGLYWVDCYARQRAKEYADHVLVALPRAAGAIDDQAQLLAIVRAFAPYAPEAATFDDQCSNCVLADQDFARLERSLLGLNERAGTLADAQCRNWTELERALGGAGECPVKLARFYLSMAGRVIEISTDSPGLLPGEPPAKDPGYARFAGPIHERCVGDWVDDSRSNTEISTCYEGEIVERTKGLRENGANLAARFHSAWRAYQTDVCTIESLVVEDMPFGVQGRSYSHCDWTANLRGAFLLESWSRDDSRGFLAHLLQRQAWGKNQVRAGLTRVRDYAKLPVCPRKGDDTSTCRFSSSKVDRWKSAASAINGVEARADALANVICAGWSGLGRALGKQCLGMVSNYLLSFADSVGKVQSTGDR